MKKRIVIIGGGFGGIITAMRLARRRVDAEIILLDKQSHHLYTPWLYRIPSDAWQGREGRICEFPFEMLFRKFRDKVHIRKAEARSVNQNSKHVILANGKTVAYDILVIATGSSVNYFGMKSVEEESHVLNTPRGVKDMYIEFEKICKALKEGKKKNVVFAGAGPTGVETALELSQIKKRHNLKKLDITLVDAGERLFPHFSKTIQRAAERRVRHLGLRVLHETRVTGATKEGVVITVGEKEEKLHADLFIWCGGVEPSSFVNHLPFEKDKRGRVMVNEQLQVKNDQSIFVLGDNASVWDEHNKQTVPPTAWAATDQGVIVARNIMKMVQGGEASMRYRPPHKYPGIIALGGKVAAGGGYGLQLAGILGWLLKQFVHIQYFLQIMSMQEAFKAWLTKKNVCDSKK